MEPQIQSNIVPVTIGLPSLVEYFSQHDPFDVRPDITLFNDSLHNSLQKSITKQVVMNTPQPTSETSSATDTDKESETYSEKSLSPESKSHSCYVCGKVLASTSSYYVHMKRHSGHKPYHCPMCDVSFCRKPYLEVHMRTHTGERPFECNVCLKRFTQKSSLNIHKRGHTGERPYSCEICDKKFAVKSYVDAHRWTHIFEKPLTCDKCHIPFNSRSQYVLHMRSHSASLAYMCPCGRTFTKDSYLIRHQIKVHGSASGENASLSDIAFNHLLVSDADRRNEYDFPTSPQIIVRSLEPKRERASIPSSCGKELDIQHTTASQTTSTIASVIRNTIQTYVQSASGELNLAKM